MPLASFAEVERAQGASTAFHQHHYTYIHKLRHTYADKRATCRAGLGVPATPPSAEPASASHSRSANKTGCISKQPFRQDSGTRAFCNTKVPLKTCICNWNSYTGERSKAPMRHSSLVTDTTSLNPSASDISPTPWNISSLHLDHLFLHFIPVLMETTFLGLWPHWRCFWSPSIPWYQLLAPG